MKLRTEIFIHAVVVIAAVALIPWYRDQNSWMGVGFCCVVAGFAFANLVFAIGKIKNDN